MHLMSFISGQTIHGLGKYSASQAVECSFRGIWGKRDFYRMLGKAVWKRSMID